VGQERRAFTSPRRRGRPARKGPRPRSTRRSISSARSISKCARRRRRLSGARRSRWRRPRARKARARIKTRTGGTARAGWLGGVVLWTGFGQAAAPVARELLADPDNRVRVVAYGWYGLHPDPAALQPLLSALDTERSEFVRPVLTRTVAAYGDDPRARTALLP